MRIDLCSVTQKDKRTFSFMSQMTGLMADVDIGTENLRWMGDARFVYGYLRGGTSFYYQYVVLTNNNASRVI